MSGSKRECEPEGASSSNKQSRPSTSEPDHVTQQAGRSQDHERNEKAYPDKGLLPRMQRLYAPENLSAMVSTQYDRTGLSNGPDQNFAMNAILEVLMSHRLLSTGVSKRKMALSDLYYPMLRTGRSKNHVLLFRQNNDQITPGSEATATGCCRHKEVTKCLVGAIAMALWFRFDFPGAPLSGQSFPNFCEKSSWPSIKVLLSTGSDPTKEITSDDQARLLTSCLQSVGFIPSCAADTAHVFAKRMANTGSGCSNDKFFNEMRNAGSSMEFILSSAGFSDKEHYHIPRSTAIPPESLQKKIFPWLEEIREQRRYGSVDNKYSDLDGVEFFDMLEEFRAVVLQDLVSVIEFAPQSVFAQSPIVNDPEFILFKDEVKTAEGTNSFNSRSEGDIRQLKSSLRANDELLRRMTEILSERNELSEDVRETLDTQMQQSSAALAALTNDGRPSASMN